MKEIDIYDFDKTLVPFDTGTKFVFYCCAHYPWCALLMPLTGLGLLLGAAGIISWKGFKKFCFSFMPFIPRERAVKGFWDRHEELLFTWFKDRPREAVVISASPDFLLDEIQKRAGFEGLICTKHNSKTGAIIGENCRGEEKVKRFLSEYPPEEYKVIDVYSDSPKNDMPIFRLATNACYQITDGQKRKFIIEG